MKASLQVLSIFPEQVRGFLDSSMLLKAQLKKILEMGAVNLRDYSTDSYRSVDDTPFGGNQGMLYTYPVLEAAAQAQLAAVDGDRDRLKIIYPSPRGVRLEQPVLEELAGWVGRASDEAPRRVAIVCGRYEGIDERFTEKWVDLEVSVGDFILTGGELPALMLVDGLTRLLPGVLGHEASALEESFSNGLLEYPQYTKPRSAGGMDVPEELLSGHHRQIKDWQLRQSILMTAAFRPDLIRSHRGSGLPNWAKELLEKVKIRLDHKTI